MLFIRPLYNITAPLISAATIRIAMAVCTVLLFIGMGLLAPSAAVADQEKPQAYRALVVGVGKYDHRPPVPRAVSNARELAWILRHNHYDVTLLTDPTAKQFHQALNNLVSESDKAPGSIILLYFCGLAESHITPDGVEIGWLIPRDCPVYEDEPASFTRSAVSTFLLDRLTEKVTADQMLIVLDASFSSDTFEVKKPVLRLHGITAAHTIRQYIFTQPRSGKPLPETNLFFEYLVRGLKGQADTLKDGWITGSEMALYLSQNMAVRNDRKVQYAVPRNPDYATGDVTLKALTLPQKTGCLYVDATPAEATVRIMNIRPKFQQGMDLEPGSYHLAITASGFNKLEKWIDVTAGSLITETIALEEATTTATNTLGMTFRWIDPGPFFMGTPADATEYTEDETRHMVHLSKGFFIQTTEVTQAQYGQFLTTGGYKSHLAPSDCWRGAADGKGWHKAGSNIPTTSIREIGPGSGIGRQPVTCVSWNDALAFASWLSDKEGKQYQLPTEAQWEYACRAGRGEAFAFGSCLSREQAHYDSSRRPLDHCRTTPIPATPSPMPIGTTMANDWGLFDMHGNVAEWCSDWYAAYPGQEQRDQEGPRHGVEKVIRGGHFRSFANECRSARRSGLPPDQAADTVGFRLVLVP